MPATMPPMPAAARRRRVLLALVLGALALALAFQGTRGLYDRTETRHAEVARETLAAGALVPRLDGEPLLSEPPLTPWALAGGLRLLGANAWGARLAGAVAFALTALAVALLGERLWDARTGVLAGVVYATALVPVAAANVATPEALLALWAVLAALAYWTALQAARGSDPGRSRAAMCGVYLCLALGLLTAGDAGLLPLAPIAGFHWTQRSRGAARPHLLDGIGLLLAVALVGAWYTAAATRQPVGLLFLLRDQVLAWLTPQQAMGPVWQLPLLYVGGLALGGGVWVLPWLAASGRPARPVGAALRRLWRIRPALRFLAWWGLLPPVLLAVFGAPAFPEAPWLEPAALAPWLAAGALLTARLLVVARRRLPRSLGPTRLAVAGVVLAVVLKGGVALLPVATDAAALAARVDALAGDTGTVLVVGPEMGYGLRFYRRGGVQRVVTGGGVRGDLTLAQALAAIRQGDLPGPVVAVARRNQPQLADACQAAGIACRLHGTVGEYRLYVFLAAGAREVALR